MVSSCCARSHKNICFQLEYCNDSTVSSSVQLWNGAKLIYPSYFSFYHLVLYPRVREDIRTHKKLNWHLYQALKKATFRSQAFYRGILIPLCEAGDCTLKEAMIIGSLLKKCTIPSEQSSVVLIKLAQMPYTGANSIFIRYS